MKKFINGTGIALMLVLFGFAGVGDAHAAALPNSAIREVKLEYGGSSRTLGTDGQSNPGHNGQLAPVLPGDKVNVIVTIDNEIANLDVSDFGGTDAIVSTIGWRMFSTDQILDPQYQINNSGIGENPVCYGPTMLLEVEDGLYSIEFEISASIAPGGERNLYLRAYEEGDCGSDEAWTDDGGPQIYWRALNIQSLAGEFAGAGKAVSLLEGEYKDVLVVDPVLVANITPSDGNAPKWNHASNQVVLVGSHGGAQNGTAVLQTVGDKKNTIRYTPDDGFRGVDVVRYHVNAGNLNQSNNPGGVNARPYDGTIVFVVLPEGLGGDESEFDLSAFGAQTVGQTTVLNVPVALTLTGTASDTTTPVTVNIPAGTTFTAQDGEWSGELFFTAEEVDLTDDLPAGTEAAIEIGLGETPILLSQPVKITFAGKAGKSVGWSQGDGFTEIVNPCNSPTNPSLGEGADCKINVGNDLIVWTRHLTTFAVYPAPPAPPSTSSRGSGGGGGPVYCTAQRTTFCMPMPGSDNEQVLTQLRAQVQALMTQLAALGGTVPAALPGTVRDLDLGSTGADVTALQNLLMAQGHSIPAGATGYFGTQTKSALSAYQSANGISPAAGYFGAITRAQMKAVGHEGLWW